MKIEINVFEITASSFLEVIIMHNMKLHYNSNNNNIHVICPSIIVQGSSIAGHSQSTNILSIFTFEQWNFGMTYNKCQYSFTDVLTSRIVVAHRTFYILAKESKTGKNAVTTLLAVNCYRHVVAYSLTHV